jgi:hypothetical protein
VICLISLRVGGAFQWFVEADAALRACVGALYEASSCRAHCYAEQTSAAAWALRLPGNRVANSSHQDISYGKPCNPGRLCAFGKGEDRHHRKHDPAKAEVTNQNRAALDVFPDRHDLTSYRERIAYAA